MSACLLARDLWEMLLYREERTFVRSRIINYFLTRSGQREKYGDRDDDSSTKIDIYIEPTSKQTIDNIQKPSHYNDASKNLDEYNYKSKMI